MARDNFEILIKGGVAITDISFPVMLDDEDDPMFPNQFGLSFAGDAQGSNIEEIEAELQKLLESEELLIISIKPKNIEVKPEPAGAGSDSEIKK